MIQKIKYRLAKINDAKDLAKLHIKCAKSQKGGFFHKLGFIFLKNYYKIEINNPSSLILIAENENNQFLGFHSGTLKAEEHFKSLKRNRILLFLCILPKIFIDIKLLKEIYNRYISISHENSKINFGIKEGPRGEYWGWDPSVPNPKEALILHKKWHLIFKNLGADYVRSEVDLINERVYKSIKIMGGNILEEITLKDGRNRAIVEYDLSKYEK
jgi:hypothetical protein